MPQPQNYQIVAVMPDLLAPRAQRGAGTQVQ